MRTLLCSLAIAGCLCTTAAAQEFHANYPRGNTDAVNYDSGLKANLGDKHEVVWSDIVAVPEMTSLRLFFDQAVLGSDSYVRITSLLDGDVQQLNANMMNVWDYSTAYFNGSMLSVELVAAPKTTNHITIGEVFYIDPNTEGDPGQCGICGPDDRAPSADNRHCRMLPAGCSATIYNEDSCWVSAGHCIAGGDVLQFNVPNSNGNCTINNPPAADQFPITSVLLENAGVGDDWACGTSGFNTLGQQPFDRYGVFRPIGVVPGGGTLTQTGYGVDTNCTRSQTQQTSTGNITGIFAQHIEFNTDVRGGNSGSGDYQNDGAVFCITTHCSFGCPNFATRVDVADFAAARAQICESGGDPTGACCFSDGSCADGQTQIDCEKINGGIWQGPNTLCSQVQCGPGGSCGDPGAGDCFVANGTPFCDDADCCELICSQDPFCCDTEWDQICADAAIAQCGGTPVGACCFEDGSCVDGLPQSECESGGGNYQGDGSICGKVQCPQPPEKCQGDFDGDGQVGITDLLFLLSLWGPCNTGDCEANVCPDYTFECDPSGLCICAPVFGGGSFCVDGSTPCGDPCAGDGSCPPGMVCLLDTCCGPTVCVPADAECGGSTAQCENPWECVGQIENCTDPDPTCFCFKGTDGLGACALDGACNNDCPNGDSDCPPGMICIIDSCCADPTCLPVCGSEAAGAAPRHGELRALGVYGIDYIYENGIAVNLREIRPVQTLTGVYGQDYIHQGGQRIDLTNDGFDVAFADDNPDCPADLDFDNQVGVTDLLKLLSVWGPCPGTGGDCDAPFECGGPITLCDDGVCICFQGDGGPACLQDTSCASTPCPNGDADCPPGMGCIVASCCTGPVCAPTCAGAAQAEPELGEERSLGVYGVDFIIENGNYVLLD